MQKIFVRKIFNTRKMRRANDCQGGSHWIDLSVECGMWKLIGSTVSTYLAFFVCEAASALISRI